MSPANWAGRPGGGAPACLSLPFFCASCTASVVPNLWFIQNCADWSVFGFILMGGVKWDSSLCRTRAALLGCWKQLQLLRLKQLWFYCWLSVWARWLKMDFGKILSNGCIFLKDPSPLICICTQFWKERLPCVHKKWLCSIFHKAKFSSDQGHRSAGKSLM